MDAIKLLFGLLLITLVQINAEDACKKQIFLKSPEESKIQTRLVSDIDCLLLRFGGNEKFDAHLGLIRLAATIENNKEYLLNISFLDVKWTKSFLKLSQEDKSDTSLCRIYLVEDEARLPISEVFDPCVNHDYYNSSVNYVLELRAEGNTETMFKRLIFKFPSLESFRNTVPLQQRSIFISVDTSSNYVIFLKIQALPPTYNVTYYKVEVFKKADKSNALIDVRMLNAEAKEELSFEYITYNEEGHYFFMVSAVNDICPEDACLKTVSPTIRIRRRYPPVVIGIVGASFLIPFVLFIFHMWTRRSQMEGENREQKDSVFLVYNQTPEKHYHIVKALEKSLKSLAKVQIATVISEASYVIYICGAHSFDPDPATHKYLVIEANKAVSRVEIFVVSFQYSTKEIPPYLKKCLRFDLMEDFSKFIHLFNCEAEFENNTQYRDLVGRVNSAQIHTEPKKIILNMPIIIVTEQSDSDAEPKEGDVLL